MSESWIDREVLALTAANFATDLKILDQQTKNEETIISLLTEIRDLLKGSQDGR